MDEGGTPADGRFWWEEADEVELAMAAREMEPAVREVVAGAGEVNMLCERGGRMAWGSCGH